MIYECSDNGQYFGRYSADTEQGARDQCAQDAGYKSEADMVARLDSLSELIASAEDGYFGNDAP